MKKNINEIIEEVKKVNVRSAWSKGVKSFALDLLDNVKNELDDINQTFTFEELKKLLLKGANDWHQYSWGGCYLIYDTDIANALCNASELKKTKNGLLKPNKNEEWLDVQARALYQSERLIRLYSFEH